MQLSDHTNSPRQAIDALVLGPSAALNRDPTAAPGVDNTPQAVPQTTCSTATRSTSTIDGYRTAIVDTLGPSGQHIAHNEDLHRLFSSFHRDRPKNSRNLPKWNLSVVLNEPTKAPFEPMKDTDLKHHTLKTAFLANFGLLQAPQRNPCLGCKQSI